MRTLTATFVMFSTLALFSSGCGDKKAAPPEPAADEVVLSVPGLT